MNQMTFKEEDGYIVCYINGKEVSRAKKASAGASTQDVIDIINDQIKANPELSGTEPNLEGLEVSGDKYAVPQGGGSSLMSDIVDANGNPRFVEADGEVVTETSKFTPSYCKWSLSGTHLMCVLAGKVKANVYITSQSYMANFTLPSYIGSKIFPVYRKALESRVINIYDLNGAIPESVNFEFRYENNVISFVPQADIHITTDGYFRIQFDLLIDSE